MSTFERFKDSFIGRNYFEAERENEIYLLTKRKKLDKDEIHQK